MANHIRKGPPPSAEEWRNSPQNPRNNPKISEEENQRIIEEALADGEVWEVQEQIYARRSAEREAGG